MADYAVLVRVAALVAAVAVVAGPWLVAAARSVRLPSRPAAKTPDTLVDAHTVLEIASRLKSAGNSRGVELCQQLIDVMLQPSEPDA
jgi:hypothetical protein